MSRLTRCEIPNPLPPYQLVPRLGPGVRALDGLGPGGWGTPPGALGPGLGLLALEPELELQGGLAALEAARRWLLQWRTHEPLAALVIGWLSYDLGRRFQRIPEQIPVHSDLPEVSLACFRAVYLYDYARSHGQVVGSDPGAVHRLASQVQGACALDETAPPLVLSAPRARSTDQAFRAGVRAIQAWIQAGDVYQVNLSRRLDLGPVATSSLPRLYRQITARAGAPFSAYLDSGDTVVLSNSPERFLRVVGDRIETCPIKGTRPRGRDPEQDAWLAKELLHAEKDRAEHVMIVDLERNDLGRICRTGSVRVQRMAELQRLPTVFHLVSSVQGQLRDPGDWTAILRATFPGGSITGAPKLRAMEIIESLEPVRRGVYTGAVGYFDAAGGLDLAIAIRTAVSWRSELSLHVGAGIVADSDPQAELLETRQKVRAFAETWEPHGSGG